MDSAHRVFIGWDARENDAWLAARASLLHHAGQPVCVQAIREPNLRVGGIYCRDWIHNGDRRVDAIDGRPFSTDFAFTRFLVPLLCQYEGWALFCDCDFLFRADVSRLFDDPDPAKAVYVVQHDYAPPEGIKMDGQVQQAYPRKNWSSFILWNCGHPKNCALTQARVNREPGSFLHRFAWLDDADIGALDGRWNWLVGHSREANPYAVHFTEGGPWFANYQDVPYADEWHWARRLADTPHEIGRIGPHVPTPAAKRHDLKVAA